MSLYHAKQQEVLNLIAFKSQKFPRQTQTNAFGEKVEEPPKAPPAPAVTAIAREPSNRKNAE